VRARVAKGGHDIPDVKIRERYDAARVNLIQLMPRLTELWVYDNSDDADPHTGVAPEPAPILHMTMGKIVNSCDLAKTPEWTKPILATAVKLQGARG
jgi:predicted ABC-type ATPase